MKKNLPNLIGKILGVLILLGIPVFLYFLISSTISFISSLKEDNLVTFFSILFSSLIGLFIYLIQKYYEKKKEIDIELIKKKSEAFKELINLWFDYNFVKNEIFEPKELEKRQNELIKSFFDSAQKNLFLWANEQTLIFYSIMRRKMAAQSYTNHLDMMKDLGTFMKLIRKELGHNDKKLKISDIYGLWVNDETDELKLLD